MKAFKKVLEYAFTENDVYRVTTGCWAENIGSEKVMIKCGLIKEAEHLDWEWHDGKMKTRLEYRLLKNEWLLSRILSGPKPSHIQSNKKEARHKLF